MFVADSHGAISCQSSSVNIVASCACGLVLLFTRAPGNLLEIILKLSVVSPWAERRVSSYECVAASPLSMTALSGIELGSSAPPQSGCGLL